MSVEIKRCNIFNSGCNIIGHQVNCMGIMGGGLARQVRFKYPSVYTEYKKLCDTKKSECLGGCQILNTPSGQIIANIFGENTISRNKCDTIYPSLKHALEILCDYAKEHNLSVALPYYLGCGLAGGDWATVYSIIDDVFSDYNVTLCKLGC